MAYLRVEKWDENNKGRKIELGQSTILVGKSSSSSMPDIPIDDPYVSREHVKIVYEKNYYKICDLGSTNGTCLNGKKIMPGQMYELKHDDTLELPLKNGERRVIFRFVDGTEPRRRFEIDDKSKAVYVDGTFVKLAKLKYLLFKCLYDHAGTVCSHDLIEQEVYKAPTGTVSPEAIEALVKNLRAVIEKDPSNPEFIVTNRGFGYMLVL